MERAPAGIILPRNYGVVVNNAFLTPLSYGVGSFLIRAEHEIDQLLFDYARRNSLSEKKVKKMFVQGVKKRTGTKNVIKYTRRTERRKKHKLVLKDFAVRAGKITGNSKTKRRGTYTPFTQMLPLSDCTPNISFPQSTSFTRNSYYLREKGSFSFIEPSLAAAEILYHLPVDEALLATGLDINTLFGEDLPKLPFEVHLPGQEPSLGAQALNDLVIEYFMHGLKQYDVNVVALANTAIYTPELVKEITREDSLSRFEVIRERERKKRKKGLKGSELQELEARVKLIRQIERRFDSLNYRRVRYSREFDSPHEMVATRFEPKVDDGRPVYSLITSENHPPILVRRFLGKKASKWNGLINLTIDDLPNKLGEEYITIDDVTRREARTRILLPDEGLKKGDYTIPPILQQQYDALREQKK